LKIFWFTAIDNQRCARDKIRSLRNLVVIASEELRVKRFTQILVIIALVVITYPTAWSQDSIPFVPSPMHVVQRMLEVAEFQKGDILYDMGSGDGRIVIEAAKKFGIRGVGIDLNPELVAKARENAEKEGVSHLVEFRAQDGLTVDISEATVVTLYMFKWFNNAIRPKLQKLKPGSRVIAHDFDIDDWKPTRVEYVAPPTDGTSDYAESRTLYIWKVGETPVSN
jgi:cyclopropane fatty-acyl-phospholipid synthase-like methyltransferase